MISLSQFYLFSIIAPTQPANLSVNSPNSTSIKLIWEPPIYPNGIIKSYTVTWIEFNATRVGKDGNRIQLGNDTFVHIIGGLSTCILYNISIFASTRCAGCDGPPASQSIVTSAESEQSLSNFHSEL